MHLKTCTLVANFYLGKYKACTLLIAIASLGNLDNASDQKPDEEDEPEGHKPEGDESSEEKATSMTVPEESRTLPNERSEWVKWRSEEMEQTAKKPIELCNICNFIAEV